MSSGNVTNVTAFSSWRRCNSLTITTVDYLFKRFFCCWSIFVIFHAFYVNVIVLLICLFMHICCLLLIKFQHQYLLLLLLLLCTVRMPATLSLFAGVVRSRSISEASKTAAETLAARRSEWCDQKTSDCCCSGFIPATGQRHLHRLSRHGKLAWACHSARAATTLHESLDGHW